MGVIRSALILITILLFASCSNDIRVTDKSQVEQRVEKLLAQMTLEEKMQLTHANTKFSVGGVERLGIPDWSMSDGPHGVREEIEPHSWNAAGWTTDSASYFPTGTALSATWNPDLAYKFGQALGQEARARNKDVILGPGINIMRTPLCGRNFEYMGEDPYLITEMVVLYIRGVQEQDVAASLKHFALNNQEYERSAINVEISERALREIYLPGYEAAVKKGEVLTVMAAYNKFRGAWCSENDYLLNAILKDEWGFKGVVMSDWNGTHSTVAAAEAGLDVEMGTTKDNYDDYYFARPLLDSVKSGRIAEEIVEDKARRVLTVMFKSGVFDEDRSGGSFTTPEHIQTARNVAEEAVVLLKNDKNVLPLKRDKIKSVAVIGDNATRRHAKGGGSSGIKALYEITPLQGLKNKVGADLEINYAPGYKKSSTLSWNKGLIDTFSTEEAAHLRSEAVSLAKKSDVAVIFAGLNHDFDAEGWDRKDMKLPYAQDELIAEVFNANPNTIVVLISGSPVEMPWADKVPAILQGWYAGMEAGNVFADILFGDVNPSGKLTFTFPQKLNDSPAHYLGVYPGEDLTANYEEDIFVGYRWFESKDIKPLFCFGHGLSYSTFEYSDLMISNPLLTRNEDVIVSLKVKNTSARAGRETVQLYIEDPRASLKRPPKELKDFKKVLVQPGESKDVEFTLNTSDLSFYDEEAAEWRAEAGQFIIHVGSSSQDIRLSKEFTMTN